MDGPRFEMLWDCPSCGTRGLLGLTHRYCPSCGAAQDETRRYFPPAEQAVAVVGHAFVGADRVCAACGSPQSARSEHCGACGAPLAAAPEARTREVQVAGAPGFASDDAAAARAELGPRRSDPPTPPGARRRWPVGWIVGATVVFVLALVAALVVALTWTTPSGFVVEGFGWERVVVVERLALVEERAWRDELPAGADVLRCEREVRGHRQIPDGQTCTPQRQDLGDGSFTEVEHCTPRYRDEPVYGERCTHRALRWGVEERRIEQGDDKAPRWPGVDDLEGCATVGCRRQGPTEEVYRVRLRGPDGGVQTCEPDEAAWGALALGQALVLPVGLGGGVRCEALTP